MNNYLSLTTIKISIWKYIKYHYELSGIFSDCTAPYNLDIYFDAFADKDGMPPADGEQGASSCGMISSINYNNFYETTAKI